MVRALARARKPRLRRNCKSRRELAAKDDDAHRPMADNVINLIIGSRIA